MIATRCLPLWILALPGPTGVPADEPPRQLDAMEDPSLYTPAQPELGHRWTGTVHLETRDFREGQGCLRFEVHSARTGVESYPQWGRSLDPAQNDWTRYRALRYWVKVVSQNPTVTVKNMCIVVYNGDSPRQQFVIHEVPVGRWVQLRDNLLNYHRDRVRGLVIYLYETDPTIQDDYTWWVDGLELVPLRPGEVAFDGNGVVPQAAPVQRPLQPLAAADGLALVFDAQGRIVQVRDRQGVLFDSGEQARALSGLLIRDWSSEDSIRPVAGPLSRQGEALRQEQVFDDGLAVRATYWPTGDRLKGHVTVWDTRPADRPLSLYFALPVEATGWTWWDDIRTTRPIEGQEEFWYNPSTLQAIQVSPYPFCCVSNGSRALSLATPLSYPRLQRLFYSPNAQALVLAYPFCLSPAAIKQGQTAEFEFDLFASDPAWGFRSTAAKYYAYYPEAFVKRIPRDGGWGCWGSYEGNPAIPDLGFLYHWGPDGRGVGSAIDALRFDNQQGYFAFPYIEWTNMHITMEGYPEAGPREVTERVRWVADPQRTEPLPLWKYHFPYDECLGPDYDGWMRAAYQAYLKSAPWEDGLIHGTADRREFDLLVAKYIPFNPDPDIPGGAGEFFLTRFWPALEQHWAAHGVRVDGFGWDNFYVSGNLLMGRRDHLAAADEPLTFDPATLKPVVVKDMATYELQRRVVASLRAQGRYLIANQGVISPVPSTLALLDIFGYEWNIQNTFPYARTMAYHKPVCSLPMAAEHYRDPYVREHLLYGCWPGGYYSTTDPEYVALMRSYVPILRRLSAAGWEPVTRAWTDDPQVQIERFGGEGGREVLFTLKNHSQDEKTVHLRFDPQLGLDGTEWMELVSGEGVGDGSTLRIPAGRVVVLGRSAAPRP